jgi:hypothetical protein
MSNLNILTINTPSKSNYTINDYITIGNSLKINQTFESSNNNENAGILLKDGNSIDDGTYYPIKIDSSSNTVQLLFNSNVVIDTSNLISELEGLLELTTLDISNLSLSGGYINFTNGSIPNSNIGSTGVGLRYSTNNTVQFKNVDTGWIDLVDITKHDQFVELIDVDVTTTPLLNNQYIKYNSTSQKYVNSNLAISNDINPTLGGNLRVGNNLIIFNNQSNRLVINDNNVINNNLIVLKNNSTFTNSVNYLEINNSTLETSPSIIARSYNNANPNVGLSINAIGTGDIQINTPIGNIQLNAVEGNIIATSDSLEISGYIKSSIYRSSSKVGGYLPGIPWNIPLTSDTILFDFASGSGSGTYWANVGAGFTDGQKLNIIYNNKTSNNITVLANFGTNSIITGTGYNNGLVFSNIGQSASLIYLANDIGTNINAWQVLSTGSGVF